MSPERPPRVGPRDLEVVIPGHGTDRIDTAYSLGEPSLPRGRTLLLFRDGRGLRYVAWRRKDAVIRVSSSLSLGLTNAQLPGIAGSLARIRL